jgi:hypothetical protein
LPEYLRLSAETLKTEKLKQIFAPFAFFCGKTVFACFGVSWFLIKAGQAGRAVLRHWQRHARGPAAAKAWIRLKRMLCQHRQWFRRRQSRRGRGVRKTKYLTPTMACCIGAMTRRAPAPSRYMHKPELFSRAQGRCIPELEWNAPAHGLFHAALGMYRRAQGRYMHELEWT